MVIMFSLLGNLNNKSTEEIGYKALNQIIEKEQLESAEIRVDGLTATVSGEYKSGDTTKPFTAQIVNNDEVVKEIMTKLQAKTELKDFTTIDGTKQSVWLDLLISFLPIVLTFAVLGWLMTKMSGGGGMRQQMDVVKSKAKIQTDVKARFDDVAGAEEEKEEVKELIDYLQNPKRFEAMGARIPKGILLVGPPGTGKTLLARATAGEADVPFYSVSGSDFVELFVGAGAGRVRDMFKTAKQTAPCIIFIDEIDAVGRQRGAGLGGGNDEREQTLNQLLVEMDGIDDNAGVLIMAATNRADVLDPALLRPGRFDRQVTVSLPDRKGREAILKVHARNKKIADGTSLASIAQRTPGFSGADLENVLNEAAILAVRENKKEITLIELDEAIDRTMMGPAKHSRTYNDEEKRLVAYHEAGHAVIGINLEKADKVAKITIIPRGDAGGYNLMMPEEETFMQTKSQLIAKITGLLGGRSAEEIVLDDISTGAQNDIQRATQIARMMVVELGMSDLGPVQYQRMSQEVFLGRDYGTGKEYSEEVAGKIDSEVRRIIEESHQQARQIITDNRAQLDIIAEHLIDQETLTQEEIENIAKGLPIDYVEEKEVVEQTKEEVTEEN
ncbi:MAG: ATP-dependent zinc metalloprotease FtsH [Erysipelothrix sp.]|nr:ATP-dependent zinc metalloprotease FtsH [Erysipelothrix sp.]